MKRISVIGARAVVEVRPGDYRVVCATCEGGGTVSYPSRDLASRAAARDSGKPCPAKYPCGAR